jgi:hypothetical protein
MQLSSRGLQLVSLPPNLAGFRKRPLLESQTSIFLTGSLVIVWLYFWLRYNFWSFEILLGLGWLSFASVLIKYSRAVISRFFDDVRLLVEDDSVPCLIELAKESHDRATSNLFFLFSGPLVVGIVVLTFIAPTFPTASLKLCAATSLAVIFLFAGKGFWGVFTAVSIIYQLTRLKLRIDPFYPDGKGGFGIVENFLNKVGWCFFTGGLLLPMAYRFGRDVSSPAGKSLVYGFLILFFVTGIIGMFVSKLGVDWVYRRIRTEAMKESAKRMRGSLDGDQFRKELQIQAFLEKTISPGPDKKKVFTTLLQPLIGALPLGGTKYAAQIQAIVPQLKEAVPKLLDTLLSFLPTK